MKKILLTLLALAGWGVASAAHVPSSNFGESWHSDLRQHGFVYSGMECTTDGKHPSVALQLLLAEPRTDKSPTVFRLEVKATAGDGENFDYVSREISRCDKIDLKVTPALSRLHGRCQVETVFVDVRSGYRAKLGAFNVTLPDYLEIIPLPFRSSVAVNRAKPEVHIGLKLNDEPHDVEDVVHVSACAPDGKEFFSQDVKLTCDTATWLDLPVTADAPVGTYRILATTVRDFDVPVKVESRFQISAPGRFFVDQDGMAMVGGIRKFSFDSDNSLTNVYESVAAYALGESRGVTSTFADKLIATRKQKGPSAAIMGMVDLAGTSRDTASDERAIRSLAYLGLVAGANGIRWNLEGVAKRLARLENMTRGTSAKLDAWLGNARMIENWRTAKEVEREIALLGADVLWPGGKTLISTDGFVYARVCGNKMICVNTERLTEHDSVLRVREFAGRMLSGEGYAVKVSKDGELRLELPVDGIAVLEAK